MKNRTVGATEFKAHCLAMLDEVFETGKSVTVTKRGRPVATVEPVRAAKWKSPAGALAGKVKIVGDIDQFDMADLWDVVRENESRRQSKR